MSTELIHRFEQDGKRFAIDPESCFCFECDEISWDVLAYYPATPVNRIYHELGERHDVKELAEVIGELEWLRSTKSILSVTPPDQAFKQFEVERGLKRLSVRLPETTVQVQEEKRGWFGKAPQVVSNTAREVGRAAVGLLLGRSGNQASLEIEFVEAGVIRNPECIADLCTEALKQASLAGKKLTAAVRVADIDLARPLDALRGHGIAVRLEFTDPSDVASHLTALAKADFSSLSRLAKAVQPGAPGVSGRIVVCPNHADFGAVVPALDKAGFSVIELDLHSCYVVNPDLKPEEMLEGLSKSAVYYAERLLRGRYFRLDPIAALFYHIHEGKTLRRSDPAGTNELAVDRDGALYPSWRMVGQDAFRAGSVLDASVDEELLRQFDDVGSLTTGICRRCWARNLCGGGCAAVHHALTGSIRTPHEAWCDAQRAWMGAAVSAFNLLSAEGVNFTRIYQTLGGAPAGKLSLLTKARAALQMTVAMRPIEESDAEMLAKWENWSDSSYFLCHPRGLLLATVYDREMDALHPQTLEQEMVLTRRDGTAFGFLRLGPGDVAGVAQAWVFMKDPADYDSEEVRKGFRLLLGEAGKDQQLRRIVIPAADREPALHRFLEALGFSKAGTFREALYLHGQFHDVSVFALDCGE